MVRFCVRCSGGGLAAGLRVGRTAKFCPGSGRFHLVPRGTLCPGLETEIPDGRSVRCGLLALATVLCRQHLLHQAVAAGLGFLLAGVGRGGGVGVAVEDVGTQAAVLPDCDLAARAGVGLLGQVLRGQEDGLGQHTTAGGLWVEQSFQAMAVLHLRVQEKHCVQFNFSGDIIK